MNHCRAVRVPIIMILGNKPFHMPARYTQKGYRMISKSRKLGWTKAPHKTTTTKPEGELKGEMATTKLTDCTTPSKY